MTWRESAACLGLDSDIFFVEVGKPTKQAKAICETCRVSAQCLDYAVTTHQDFGVWGGVGRKHRQAIRSGGSLEQWEDDPAGGSCKATDCDLRQVARGLCEIHYRRLMRHGDPNISAPKGRPPAFTEAELLALDHLTPQQAAVRLRADARTVRRHRARLADAGAARGSSTPVSVTTGSDHAGS